MSKIFTRLPIMSVEVPHKGYTVSMNFALDQHSITLMAVPAKGNLHGRLVNGYSFKVTQYGSIPITGGVRASELIREIETALANTEKATAIAS